jgi:hypothetical protein
MIERMFDTMTEGPEAGVSVAGRLDVLVWGEHAVRLDLLTELAAIESSEVWKQDGSTSMIDWLVGRYHLSVATAREWLRVARSLEQLPEIRRVFAEGRLSWDQLRAVLKLATAETEAEWAERAPDMTVAQLKAASRTVTRQEVVEEHDRRRVWWRFRDDRPRFELFAEMSDAEGATLATWLIRKANQYDPNPESGVYDDFETRCADALHELASQALAADRDHDRATLLIHTDLSTLLDGTGTATLANGPALANDTLRRLACDARLQLALTNNADTVIGVGRTTRTIPPWLARLVTSRDGGCRFPGCRRTRWTQIHHIQHWADGGPTDLDNLITLCGFHHRLIHEHGWTIKGNPNHNIIWYHPYGTRFQPQPPKHPLKEWKQQLKRMPPITPPPRLQPAPTPILS